MDERGFRPPHFTDYGDLVDHLKSCPTVDGRLGPAREAIGGSYSCPIGQLVERRGFSLRLAMAELLLILAGRHDLEVIRAAAPKADPSLFTYHMSYGPRLKDQLDVVVRSLMREPGTRRAVLHLSNRPLLETCSERLTCTNSIQFLIRDGVLHCIVSMRSWDAVLGLPYDVACFGGLASVVCRLVGAVPGQLLVTAGSLHAYQKDLLDLRTYDPRSTTGRQYLVASTALVGSSWSDVRVAASLYLDAVFTNHWLAAGRRMFGLYYSKDGRPPSADLWSVPLGDVRVTDGVVRPTWSDPMPRPTAVKGRPTVVQDQPTIVHEPSTKSDNYGELIKDGGGFVAKVRFPWNKEGS